MDLTDLAHMIASESHSPHEGLLLPETLHEPTMKALQLDATHVQVGAAVLVDLGRRQRTMLTLRCVLPADVDVSPVWRLTGRVHELRLVDLEGKTHSLAMQSMLPKLDDEDDDTPVIAPGS